MKAKKKKFRHIRLEESAYELAREHAEKLSHDFDTHVSIASAAAILIREAKGKEKR